MSDRYVWLLTVGDEHRAVFSSVDAAAGAFDHAYRSDFFRSIVRVPFGSPDEEDEPWGREGTYDVEFRGNEIVEVRLADTSSSPLGRWSGDAGEIRVRAMGLAAAIGVAMETWRNQDGN